jgi:hypothetical protein
MRGSGDGDEEENDNNEGREACFKVNISLLVWRFKSQLSPCLSISQQNQKGASRVTLTNNYTIR